MAAGGDIRTQGGGAAAAGETTSSKWSAAEIWGVETRRRKAQEEGIEHTNNESPSLVHVFDVFGKLHDHVWNRMEHF